MGDYVEHGIMDEPWTYTYIPHAAGNGEAAAVDDDDFRLATARDGLAGYEAWLASPDPAAHLSGKVIGDLVSAARWLAEMLSPQDARTGCDR